MKTIRQAVTLALTGMTMPLLLLAGTPQSSGAITSKNVRQAEAKAKSAADHVRIAEYYENQAKLMQAQLAETEDLVNYWLREAEAIPNRQAPSPYWSAKSRAEELLVEVESASTHAAEQHRLAQSLR